MKLTFLGATQTVTGSKYLLEVDNKKFLIDCGLYQGKKELRKRNWEDLPVNPSEIDAVILTHAHIDHSGYIPVLVKKGFHGKIHCTKSTRDLCSILLPDSGYLQEEEAAFLNKHGLSKHKPALPLYTRIEAEEAMNFFQVVDVGKFYGLTDEVEFQLIRAGHIIGATFVVIKYNNHRLVFSGDLGRPHDFIMKSPAIIQQADYLVLESTYGDRPHESIDPKDALADIVNRTIKRGGTLLIPSFAVGRAQWLIYLLHDLQMLGRIPKIPIFLDSPMAIEATHMFCDNAQAHRLSKQVAEKSVCQAVKPTPTVEGSKSIKEIAEPKIVISASGMATGGRILHHLRYYLPEKKNTVLFAGFQAPGTRGDRLVKGETEIKIFGDMIPVNAEVVQLANASAHADYNEILDWLSHFQKDIRKIFITHGEKDASMSLKEKIEKQFHWGCVIPEYKDSELL